MRTVCIDCIGAHAATFAAVPRSTSPLRFAGLATQWALMLGAAVWGGLWLDQRMHLKALWVIVLPVVALAVSLYQLIKELGKKDPPSAS